MSRLTEKEKLYGIIVGIYGIIALGFLWIPHFSGPLPKGATSPFLPWLIGTVGILVAIGFIIKGLRMPSGLVMAAAGVLGPWSTYLLLAFPLVVWAGFVSFKRGTRQVQGANASSGQKRTPGNLFNRKSAIDVKSQIRKPPSQSRRYTPPKKTKKK